MKSKGFLADKKKPIIMGAILMITALVLIAALPYQGTPGNGFIPNAAGNVTSVKLVGEYNSINVTWTAAPSQAKVTVDYNTSDTMGAKTPSLNVSSATATGLNIPNLTAGTTYYVWAENGTAGFVYAGSVVALGITAYKQNVTFADYNVTNYTKDRLNVTFAAPSISGTTLEYAILEYMQGGFSAPNVKVKNLGNYTVPIGGKASLWTGNTTPIKNNFTDKGNTIYKGKAYFTNVSISGGGNTSFYLVSYFTVVNGSYNGKNISVTEGPVNHMVTPNNYSKGYGLTINPGYGIPVIGFIVTPLGGAITAGVIIVLAVLAFRRKKNKEE